MAKVMISLPAEVLAAVDEAAERGALTRSALIRDALRLYMAEGTARDRREAVERLRRRLASVKGLDPEEAVRSERSSAPARK